MISFIGLGNPGNKYENTKHNAGFWILDELSRRWKTNFKPGKGEYFFIEKKSWNILLIKPTIGMNNSGTVVKDIMKNWNINLSELYLIVDDIDLPLGKIRIRPKGGDGCHRGMESVIYHIGNNGFPRIRFGIATGDKLRPAENYVLKSFNKKNQILANEMIVKTADAVESIIHNGMSKTMNLFNA